jgi:hypothetical protein
VDDEASFEWRAPPFTQELALKNLPIVIRTFRFEIDYAAWYARLAGTTRKAA